MGQYYKIVNVDKKEYIDPFNLDCGVKLMEFSYVGNTVIKLMTHLLATSWKGDRVYVVGDYATADYENETFYETLKEVSTELNIDENSTLYDLASSDFTNISKSFKSNDNLPNYRYIYNNKTMQYIDIEHCPIEYISYDYSEDAFIFIKIAPLPLLLTMGNGRGCGDYHDSTKSNIDFVGAWCDDIRCIEVSNEYHEGYIEFAPNFTEDRSSRSYATIEERKENARKSELERIERNMINALKEDSKVNYIDFKVDFFKYDTKKKQYFAEISMFDDKGLPWITPNMEVYFKEIYYFRFEIVKKVIQK